MWHENVLIYTEVYNPILIFEIGEYGHFLSKIVDIKTFMLNICSVLAFWRRNYIFKILAHPVYKM